MKFHPSNQKLFLIVFEQFQKGDNAETKETIYALTDEDLSAFQVMSDFLLSRSIIPNEVYVIQRSDFFAQADNQKGDRRYKITVSKEPSFRDHAVVDIH